jgi:hypothetical protein
LEFRASPLHLTVGLCAVVTLIIGTIAVVAYALHHPIAVILHGGFFTLTLTALFGFVLYLDWWRRQVMARSDQAMATLDQIAADVAEIKAMDRETHGAVTEAYDLVRGERDEIGRRRESRGPNAG